MKLILLLVALFPTVGACGDSIFIFKKNLGVLDYALHNRIREIPVAEALHLVDDDFFRVFNCLDSDSEVVIRVEIDYRYNGAKEILKFRVIPSDIRINSIELLTVQDKFSDSSSKSSSEVKNSEVIDFDQAMNQLLDPNLLLAPSEPETRTEKGVERRK